jgi:hypothetical protein
LPGSGGKEHSAAKRLEAGLAVHLPFHELELCDLVCRLTVAPGRRECRTYRHAILREPLSEGLHRADPAGESFVEPRIEGGASDLGIRRTVPQERDESLHQPYDLRGLAVLRQVPNACGSESENRAGGWTKSQAS